MSDPTLSIPWWRLVFALPPALLTMLFLFRWTDQGKALLHASARMLAQLTFIGYALVWVFRADHWGWVLGMLVLMAGVAGWISLRPLDSAPRHRLYRKSLACIVACGGGTLALVVFGVLQPARWYDPRVVIPLAGMIFAGAMNQISLAAERYTAERRRGEEHPAARGAALRASLIPLLNAFFAVGLVQLPGMMTGQILAGADPLVAVRYQIMVMLMLLGGGGLASAIFLEWAGPECHEAAGTEG
ncbi:MAG: ABC transporter permease [Verrucomicrobiae bacterium]|nr:ABC transporter permease [Verrucomicrobiae bacterium]MCP5540362.1 ABC transporter permease [Akkermansiaceae bacterium]MCP5550740.1 ABC transporter permease [Akkermansiaceae bacterium]